MQYLSKPKIEKGGTNLGKNNMVKWRKWNPHTLLVGM